MGEEGPPSSLATPSVKRTDVPSRHAGQSVPASTTPDSLAASGKDVSGAPESLTDGVQSLPFGSTDGSESQHCSVAVTSADGHSPAGHVPSLCFDTSPFASHEAHTEPQQATLVPLAMQVPLGQAPPCGVRYPFDSQ